MINQRRIKGVKREALSASTLGEIRARVEQIALRFNVSKSYVVSTILADAFKISTDKQERYYNEKTNSQRTRKAS